MPNDYELYPFQREGVEWISSTRDNQYGFSAPPLTGLFGDEMGLGKTAQALRATFPLIKQGKRGIFLVPGATVVQWQKNYDRWVLDNEPDAFGADALMAVRGSAARIPRDSSIVMSHALLAKVDIVKKLGEANFDFIVIDEIHKLGSIDALGGINKRMKHLNVLCNVLTASRFEDGRIALSGTPVRNYAREIYNAAHFLDPERFRNFPDFARKYLTYDRKALSNPHQFHDDFAPYYIRRTVSQVQRNLPEIRRTKLYTAITDPFVVAAYNHQLDLMSNLVKNGDKVLNRDNMTLLAYLQKLRGLVGLAKAKERAILEPMRDYLETPKEDGGGSIVIGLHHHAVRDRLVKSFNRFPYMDLRGGMSDVEKEKAKLQYIEDSKSRNTICYLSIKAAAEGIDGLQFAARKAYVFERQWNGADELQFEKRLHRTGQTGMVEMEYTMAIGTVDEFYDELVENKRKITTQVEDANYETNPAFLKQLAERVIANPLRTPSKREIAEYQEEESEELAV